MNRRAGPRPVHTCSIVAVAELTQEDQGREPRQLAVISAANEAAYSVQANMMESEAVWPAMAWAFEDGRGLTPPSSEGASALAERLLAALGMVRLTEPGLRALLSNQD